jgi:hypothetical protein
MKHRIPLMWIALLCVGVVLYTVGGLRDGRLCLTARAQDDDQGERKPSGPRPLVVDKSAPLLLEEPPEQDPSDVPLGPVADNLACHCCHANYQEEPFALDHAKANVGCVECHGDSYAHRDDEDNVTPPDVMFWPEKIESNCAECHDTHDAPAAKVIARWQERCPAETDPERLLCTDCHGQHRLNVRTVRWNKKTGELIVRGKDQQVKAAPDPPKPLPEGNSATGLDPVSEMK